MSLLLPARTRAAPHGPFNHSDENWRVVETKYFRIYASDRTPNTVRHLVRIADETYERLNRFYGVKPTHKITVSIVGYTDFANAFADSFRNRITLYSTPANFHSRSRVPWLENVFTHELSHILSLNAASHWSRSVPLVLGTGLAYGERSQTLVRLPYYTRNLPHWFVEGVAQFDTHLLGRDSFDENRAAYQRSAWEDGLFFPLGKLAFFGHEKWYNTGFSFLLYLEQRFGSGSVHRLYRAAGERHNFPFDGLFADVLGVSLEQLESEFRARVQSEYAGHLARVHRGRFDGRPIAPEGQDVPYAALSPNQRDALRGEYRMRPMRFEAGRLYYAKNDQIRHAKFSPQTLLLTDDKALAKGEALARNADHGHFVLRQEGHTPSLVPFLYRPDFESSSLIAVDPEGKERMLLEDSRIMDFDVCAERSELAGVYNDGDGNLRLALYPLTAFGSGEVSVRAGDIEFPLPPQARDEVRTPRYSPDCTKLFFSRRAGDDHDIYYWDFETERIVSFMAEDAFELYPAPGPRGVHFVSARDGTMSVYFRDYTGGSVRRLSEAVTAHHYPVPQSAGVFVSRLSGTGFHAYFLQAARRPDTPPVELDEKPDVARWTPVEAWAVPSSEYQAFAPRHLSSPLIIPIIDVAYAAPGQVAAQAGMEFLVEDTLRTHSLRFNGFVGDRSSLWVNYENAMTPITWQLRGGATYIRSSYAFERSDGQVFDQTQSTSWGFLYAVASTPLNLFYDVGLEAETIRDTGTITGARSWPFSFKHPRFARDLGGLYLSYDGLDRSDPMFRERVVNKRGYRTFDARASYAVEEVHPILEEFDPEIRGGRQPYGRFEFNHHEYIALPELMRGLFDHTLQIDLNLGYITRDIRFLPFYGGGRLRSLTTPELVHSVGFAGYGPFSLVGESLLNLGMAYRFPLARNLEWDLGPLFMEDIYAQIFTSWGNIWGFNQDGSRQRPLLDRAPNGTMVTGDVGFDLRLNHFFQQIEANVGTTLRAAYRLVPFTECPNQDVATNPACLGINGKRGMLYYLMFGAGF